MKNFICKAFSKGELLIMVRVTSPTHAQAHFSFSKQVEENNPNLDSYVMEIKEDKGE